MKNIDKKVQFMIGRDNLALTVFVPWNCTNTCQFCTSKKDYHCNQDMEVAMYKIKSKIEVFANLGIEEFVFTGGEPLANLPKLQELLDVIPYGRAVYINTTFPIQDEQDKKDKIKFINDSKKITAINISRHEAKEDDDFEFFSSQILRDKDMWEIKKPIRINTVLLPNLDLDMYFARWFHVSCCRKGDTRVSLRADYRFIDMDNLKSLQETGFLRIAEHPRLTYIGSSGCTVCNDDAFIYQEVRKMNVNYHRGLEESSIVIGSQRIVNDIIICNDGSAVYDWDKKDENWQYLRNYIHLHYQKKKKMQKRMNDEAKQHVSKTSSNTSSRTTKSASSSRRVSSGTCSGVSLGTCGSSSSCGM